MGLCACECREDGLPEVGSGEVEVEAVEAVEEAADRSGGGEVDAANAAAYIPVVEAEEAEAEAEAEVEATFGVEFRVACTEAMPVL